MTISSNKSKPVYAPLRADTGGRYHLMLSLGPGSVALLRVLGELKAGAPALLAQTRILFALDAATPEAGGAIDQFEGLGLGMGMDVGVGAVQTFDGADSLLEEFRAILDRSLMGTRLYIAGPESFIGRALQTALAFNLNKDEIRAEEVGPSARRVHCVHCRATTEAVRTNIARCCGCARWLLVRDHYSRRLAAYMGVMADAEAHGELPPIREIYT